MGSRRPSGYGYRHHFRMDDSLIPLYDVINASVDRKCYLFEIQTNFKLKKDEEEEEEEQEQVMGSERFGAVMRETDDSRWLEDAMSTRLDNYWMSIDEIKWLIDEALGFAKQKMAVDGAKYASYSVIPVVVGLDVCTVQREGETTDATMDRAIRPELMFPLTLCYVALRNGDYLKVSDEKSYILHKDFLMNLPKVRRDDDCGLPRMEVCAVCSRDSTAFPAAQVSYLPCGHVFHSHCVFRWFNGGKSSCPSCGARVRTDLEDLQDYEQQLFGSRS